MFPMTPLQSWTFLILIWMNIGAISLVFYWRERYWDAELTRLYVAGLKRKERTHLDEPRWTE